MARVILDVPAEMMQPFLQLIMKLGLDKHSITSNINSKIKSRSRRKTSLFHPFPEKFVLFDWEFFSNELEFE
ncbi:hypothetical protein ACI6Q2_16985 [Chitinophagaceae bacterium LWZ2-11]